MEQNKMTPTPWNFTWDDNGFHFVWADERMPRPYICATGRSDPDDINESNAKAIVSAINNTYGAGINPEAITDLLKAAQDFVSKVEEGKAKSKESYSKFKAAIEKAKL